MDISKKMTSIQFGQLIETKYGYIMHGHYYKKDYTPIPFKFCDIECGKNIFLPSSTFPIIRRSGDNVYSNEINTIIYDEFNENIFYLVIPSAGNIEGDLYSSQVYNVKIYKIYETEEKFEILKSKILSSSSYSNSDESTFIYQTQDKYYIYGFTVTNSSYNGNITSYKISKADLVRTSSPISSSYSPELIYDDNDMLITLAYANSITVPYSYKFSKNDEVNGLTQIGYCSAVKDPEDNSEYVYTNDGAGDDPQKTSANSKTIHNIFTTHSTRKNIKKFNGIFNAKEGSNLEIYRIMIGSESIKDDGKVNIVKFNIDIDGMKSATGNLPSPTIKTCTITNKQDEIFTNWRNKMHKLDSYYFTCKSMKFEKESNIYLVLDSYISSSLSSSTSNPDSNYVNNNIAVFKINNDDHSSLELKSVYIEPNVAHKGLVPINDDMFLLSNNSGWSILEFNYENAEFKNIKKIKKGTGWIGISENQTIMMHDNDGTLDVTKFVEVPYKPRIYPENDTIIWEDQEINANVVLEAKDFLGNNTDANVNCHILGDGVVFENNSSTTININMTKSDDKKLIPIKITKESTVDLVAIATKQSS